MELGAITALGGIIVAFGTLIGVLFMRIRGLERRVVSAEDYNRRLWLWARDLIDLYYTHRKAGSPNPPKMPTLGEPESE